MIPWWKVVTLAVVGCGCDPGRWVPVMLAVRCVMRVVSSNRVGRSVLCIYFRLLAKCAYGV